MKLLQGHQGRSKKDLPGNLKDLFTRISGNQLNLPPRHNQSDPTCTKCRESCASDIKIRSANQQERSDTHNVTRGLPVHMLDLHKTSRASRKISKNHRTCEKHEKQCFTYRSRPLFVEVNEALHLPRKMSLRQASEVLHLPDGIIIMSRNQK